MRLNLLLCCIVLLGLGRDAGSAVGGEDRPSACPTIIIEVGTGSDADRTLVCDGAARARTFFRSHGIELKRPIRLRLHQTKIENRPLHIGFYDPEKDQVDLLTFGQAGRQIDGDPLFGMTMDEALYTSIVVHEIAHAIAGQHLETRPDSRIAHEHALIAQEYIAYVAQLSTMSAQVRSKILRRYDKPGFTSINEMSSIYYELDPGGFGVKAFRHYRVLPDQTRFIQGLLSGAIRPQASYMK